MSARLDMIDPDNPPRILMVVANAGVSPVTNWPVVKRLAATWARGLRRGIEDMRAAGR